MNASAQDVKRIIWNVERLGKVFDSMPFNEQPSMVRTVPRAVGGRSSDPIEQLVDPWVLARR
jgi:hypothetical protein